jgi:hypothetical protein
MLLQITCKMHFSPWIPFIDLSRVSLESNPKPSKSIICTTVSSSTPHLPAMALSKILVFLLDMLFMLLNVAPALSHSI